MIQPPKIDERAAPDIVLQLRRLLPRYTPEWPRDAAEEHLSEALIHVFARFGEIIIDRLNRAPEKNFLAFLQLLGVSNLPRQAARVPLTFYLAAGNTGYAVVRERTQVAAQPLKGEKDPVVFETDREFVVVSTRLTSLLVKDGERDLYADLSGIVPQAPPPPPPSPGEASQPVVAATPAFRGSIPLPHLFYIGLKIFAPSPVLDRLRLQFVIYESGPPRSTQARVTWEMRAPAPIAAAANRTALPAAQNVLPECGVALGPPLDPVQDTTEGLTRSGEVIFDNVPPRPFAFLHSEPLQWFLCRLTTPVSSSTEAVDGMVRALDLPRIKSVSASFEVNRKGLQIEQGFFNNLKLDLSKDFYPFGERPKFGDTMYLGSRELFSNQGAAVTLHIEITNPVDAHAGSPIPPAAPQDVKLCWEFWDGAIWSQLGTSEESGKVRLYTSQGGPTQSQSFTDGTYAFSESGDVTFGFSKAPALATVNGQVNFWIRIRIVSGNYGQEAHREKELIGSELKPATFAPPAIRSIKADYAIQKQLQPESLISCNNFTYAIIDPSTAIQPFSPLPQGEARPALYFGFAPPPPLPSRTASKPQVVASFPGRSMSIYLDVEESTAGQSTQDPGSSAQSISWEYWNGSGWVKWTVRDETDIFHHPGLVRFLAPPDFAARPEFGLTRYWLRAIPSDPNFQAKLRMVLLNTTMAANNTTVLNELLGVSNGTPQQTFQIAHTPILTGQQLEILEPRMPGLHEERAIRSEEGDDAIRILSQTAGYEEVWIRWHEVPNFYASGPRDRHYVLDRITGKITVGDGLNGQIPPRGGKIQMAAYRTGGGQSGNRPAQNITQLKTAVPYVEKVCNWVPAGGGGDTEDTPALMERGARGTRHGNRAVTVQDFEDLALLSSTDVARAKAVPSLDLASDPAGALRKPGVVSVIVVPRSSDLRPVPGSQLLGLVLQYLRQSSSPTVQISVVGPDYLRVDVWTEIALNDPDQAATIELAVKLALTAFLHPLTGGVTGSGWDFGRKPHKSDFYSLIEDVPGVSHVREIRMSTVAERPNVEPTGRYLIYPGTLTVVPSLET
jgi:hypothetical protein